MLSYSAIMSANFGMENDDGSFSLELRGMATLQLTKHGK